MSSFSPQELLAKMVAKLDPSVVIQIDEEVSFNSFEAYLMYKIAQEHGIRPLCLRYIRHKNVMSEFIFLEGVEEEWINKGYFHLLDYPSFRTSGLGYYDVVEQLTGPQFNLDTLRRFWELTKKFGTRPLTNWKILKNIYRDKEVSVSEFCKMDHSIRFERPDSLDSMYLEELYRQYSARRTVRLLLAPKEGMQKFIRLYSKFSRGQRKDLMTRIPRKPKDWPELTKWLEREISLMYPNDLELKQLVLPWQGRDIGDLVVKIPVCIGDLLALSKSLSNCLDTYVQRVLQKESQIVALEREGVVVLAVEILPVNGRWQVKDILGPKNNPSYQGRKGKFIRDKLGEWCAEFVVEPTTTLDHF